MNKNIVNILSFTTYLFALLRVNVEEVKAKEVLLKIRGQFEKSVENWNFNSYFCEFKELIPFLGIRNIEHYNSLFDIQLSKASCYHLDFDESQLQGYFEFIVVVCNDSLRFFCENECEKMADLLDAVHALPEAILTNLNAKSYWRTYFRPYFNSWDRANMYNYRRKFFCSRQVATG